MMDKRAAFSIAEAFITLLIVSVALGSAAPLISKSMKNSQISNFQIMQLQQQMQQLRTEVINNRVPAGTIAFFADDDCPPGWTQLGNAYNGRFPRFAGNYNICDKDGETNGTCSSESTTASVAVNELQGDAIRNITGVIPTNIRDKYDNNMPEDAFQFKDETGYFYGWPDGRYNGWKISFDSSRVVPTARENRPKSVGLLGCVKNSYTD